MVAAGEKRKIARPMVNNQPLVLAKPVPPGWKHRLYGRQDARRYGCFNMNSMRSRTFRR